MLAIGSAAIKDTRDRWGAQRPPDGLVNCSGPLLAVARAPARREGLHLDRSSRDRMIGTDADFSRLNRTAENRVYLGCRHNKVRRRLPHSCV